MNFLSRLFVRMATAAVLIATLWIAGGRVTWADPAPLSLAVYTADLKGLGVTSTLIYGDHEAILVDTQFRISDAEKLADLIASKGRHLKAILVTHPHFDHYFGAAILLKRFPGTPVYASAGEVEIIKSTLAGALTRIRADFGAENIPAEIPVPTPFPTTHFTVDGQAVDVTTDLQGDVGPVPGNNVIWVPSLAAAIAGDIDFDQIHLSLRATNAQSRKAWADSLRLIQERKPRIVVAGHKNSPDLPDGPDSLAFSLAYLSDMEVALAASHSGPELIAAIKQKYPQVGLDRILNFTAATFFPKQG